MRGIISIQSHVVYGCAGNSSAVFPLQRLGFNVWPIQTVQFSNHTQYKEGWTGSVLAEGGITKLFDGLENINAMSKVSAIISGYLGTGAQALEILDNFHRVKKLSSDCIYICDPVMGDPKKGCIVSEDVTSMLCDHLVPAAHIITPNQFELSQITGVDIYDLDSAVEACIKARAMGPNIVLVKHLHYASNATLYTMMMANEDGVYMVERPLLDFSIYPVGVGDLITSIFVGNLFKTKASVISFEKTNQAVYEILKITKNLGERELQIIEAQEHISTETIKYRSTKIFSYSE